MNRRAIIVDLDGTLSNPEKRLHHLDGEPNWPAFHDEMDSDASYPAIVSLVRALYRATEEGCEFEAIVLVTARHDDPKYVAKTKAWLEVEDVPYHALYMRRDMDTRPDAVVKQEILQRMLEDGYEPVLAIDDRDSVLDMWRSFGITTLKCGAGEAPTSVYAGQTLLHMLVGPCSAGKSSYAAQHYKPHEIISTDAIRMEIYGEFNNSPEALARVWKYTHDLIAARLKAGVMTVLDATNLEAKDRARVLRQLPRGVFARYVVIDRDLGEKIRDRGWRPEDLVLKQHRMFRAEEQAILKGDEHPYVTVQDKRKR